MVIKHHKQVNGIDANPRTKPQPLSILRSFYKSDTGVHTTIYSCLTGDKHAWALLQKGGPNGPILFLTLLLVMCMGFAVPRPLPG